MESLPLQHMFETVLVQGLERINKYRVAEVLLRNCWEDPTFHLSIHQAFFVLTSQKKAFAIRLDVLTVLKAILVNVGTLIRRGNRNIRRDDDSSRGCFHIC